MSVDTTTTDRKLRIVNGAALNAAIADTAAQLGPGSSTVFALIATLWAGMPEGFADALVHEAAARLGTVDHREVFADYRTGADPTGETS